MLKASRNVLVIGKFLFVGKAPYDQSECHLWKKKASTSNSWVNYAACII